MLRAEIRMTGKRQIGIRQLERVIKGTRLVISTTIGKDDG